MYSIRESPFNQTLHLRDWSCFEVLFSDLSCCLRRGFIALENKTFIIEPVSGDDTGVHFIYRVEELRLTPGTCGHSFNTSSVENHIESPFKSFHTRVRLLLGFSFLSQCHWIKRLSYIIGLQFFTIKQVWRLGLSLNWSKINGRLTKMSILASILVWMSSLRVLPLVWHSFYQRWEHRVKGSCRRFGQCFALSRCSIHLPLFTSIKNSVWLREWNLPIYST